MNRHLNCQATPLFPALNFAEQRPDADVDRCVIERKLLSKPRNQVFQPRNPDAADRHVLRRDGARRRSGSARR